MDGLTQSDVQKCFEVNKYTNNGSVGNRLRIPSA